MSFIKIDNELIKKLEKLEDDNRRLVNENEHLKSVIETFKISMEIIKKRLDQNKQL
jgi:hypothetical protein